MVREWHDVWQVCVVELLECLPVEQEQVGLANSSIKHYRQNHAVILLNSSYEYSVKG